MRRPLRALANVSTSVLRAARSPLPAETRRKIARTAVRLAARPERREHRTVTARILDYEMRAYSIGALRFLYDEIFVRLPYLFTARRDDPLILDCGSNIGVSILFFKTLYPKSRIVAFEPSEGARALLLQNIALNRFDDVVVHPFALGGADGVVELYLDPAKPASLKASTVRERLPSSTPTQVPQARLSSFIDDDVDFLKLDVEGAECTVLHDLVESGTINRIDQMVIEYHHHIPGTHDAFGSFLRMLEAAGFGYDIDAVWASTARFEPSPAFQDISVFAYSARDDFSRAPPGS